jgi:hypothetical protein
VPTKKEALRRAAGRAFLRWKATGLKLNSLLFGTHAPLLIGRMARYAMALTAVVLLALCLLHII